jgi:hypothetical protein
MQLTEAFESVATPMLPLFLVLKLGWTTFLYYIVSSFLQALHDIDRRDRDEWIRCFQRPSRLVSSVSYHQAGKLKLGWVRLFFSVDVSWTPRETIYSTQHTSECTADPFNTEPDRPSTFLSTVGEFVSSTPHHHITTTCPRRECRNGKILYVKRQNMSWQEYPTETDYKECRAETADNFRHHQPSFVWSKMQNKKRYQSHKDNGTYPSLKGPITSRHRYRHDWL